MVVTPIANEIILIDLTGDVPEKRVTYHIPLEDGLNSLQLEKGNQYAVGLAYKPELLPEVDSDADPAGSVRSISSAVMTLGNFKIISSALDTLPISEYSNDDIDLGSLTLNEEEMDFNSEISLQDISNSTGYDTSVLEGYGTFDLASRQLMNPDINRDGEIDSDGGAYWRLVSLINRKFGVDQFDFDDTLNPVKIPIDDFGIGFEPSYMYFFNNFGLVYEEGSYDGFELLKSIPESDASQVISTWPIVQNEGDTMSLDFGIQPEHLFEGGDFIIRAFDEDILFFNSIDFLSPSDNYEGFIFPIVKAVADSGNYMKSLSWRWMQILDGNYVDADPEVVRLCIGTMFFYFLHEDAADPDAFDPEHFGSGYHYYENGTIDLRGRKYIVNADNDPNYGYFGADFWDKGDNDYAFGYPIIFE
ncbi:MAG: hypothetical protein JEY99_15060 [Spirochaetales bacterium]|nr:hypothetical protein [Spirochaetales bacterium]